MSQQRQADEDVGAVQAGQAVEDRAPARSRCGAKPMWTYSLIWMKRNVRPSRKVERIPAFSAKRLFVLTAVLGPVQRERRGHEDRRVHERHRDRQRVAVRPGTTGRRSRPG